MEHTDYQTAKDRFLLQPVSYREVDKNEIVALDESHYRIGSATVELTPSMVGNIDRYFGILPKQSKMAQDSFGGSGIANLRNFFAQASQHDKERIVLVGNTHDRKITRVHKTSHHLIPPETFFDFAEMFMDHNHYEPESVEYDDGSAVSIRMKAPEPKVIEVAPDDAIVDNGLWLRWNPTEIAFGNYYVRLVCSNGSTETTESKLLRTHSLEDQTTLTQMLNISSDQSQLKRNRIRMLENAKEAIHTQASLRELGIGARLLQRSGMEEQNVAQLIPYQENIARYEQAGFPVGMREQSLTVSDMSVWQLFNILTAFATHNQLWPAHDTRRSELMAQSVGLLNQKRDIQKYRNIYV